LAKYVVPGVLFLEGTWATSVIYKASEGGMSAPIYLLYFYGGLFFGAGLALWAIWALIAAMRRGRSLQIMRSPALLAQFIVLVTVYLAVSFGLGFRARLALSKPALRALAQHAVEGTRTTDARWVGLFRVRESDAIGGAVRFITADCSFDDCGVAYKQGGPPPQGGEDSYTDLGAGWWHWHRSW
jgi:hypothetical protein